MTKNDDVRNRIDEAKRRYGIAEDATDGILTRLIASKWSLAIVIAAVLAIFWIAYKVFA